MALPLASLMSARTSPRTPSRTNRRQVASPIPEAPPVTMATFPSSRPAMLISPHSFSWRSSSVRTPFGESSFSPCSNCGFQISDCRLGDPNRLFPHSVSKSAIDNLQSAMLSDPLACGPKPRCGRAVGRRLVSGQGSELGVDGIQEPARLREEEVLLFGCRRDPVLRAHHDHRGVEVMERQLLDGGRQSVEEASRSHRRRRRAGSGRFS